MNGSCKRVCQENCVSYFSFIYKFLYLAILLGAALYNGYTLGYAQSLSAASFSLVFSRRLFFLGSRGVGPVVKGKSG